MDEHLEALEERIGYRFKERELLQLALTHSSYANELEDSLKCNERLEFLGDAVLELCVSEELYSRFPNAQEGILTKLRAKLVGRQSLAVLAQEIGLAEHLLLGKGEESQGGRERASLLSDSVEAILGAVFVDGGYKAGKRLVGRLFKNHWPSLAEESKHKDCKSLLQEQTQCLYRERPLYILVDSSGPEHAKTFKVLVRLPGGEEVEATGPSLKKAEQKAACQALERVEKLKAGKAL